MRRRIWIPCIIAIIICVGFLLLMFGRQQRTPLAEPRDTVSTPAAWPEQKVLTNQPMARASGGTSSSSAATIPRQRDSNVAASLMLETWQAPIEFYGKVLDQDSNALAEAKVNFHWVETPTPDGNREATTESDADGLFSLQGARGPSLSVSVSKDGYYTSQRGLPHFKYGVFSDGTFSADPQSPIVFHLRKKGTAEPLLSVKRNYPVPRDGTPLSIDLATGGTTTGNTDLVVRCWTEDQGKTSGQKYNWRCLLTMDGGGLLPTDDEFAFLAPEAGYKQSIEIAMPSDRPDWKSDVGLKIFYRFDDHRYGRMKFSMIAGGQHFCMVDSVLNPSGSRNLEPAR